MSTLLTATPGQTVGPFFGYALLFDRGNELVPPGRPGAVQLHGVVTDGEGKPVPDALLEIWQADVDGVMPTSTGSLRRDGWTFTGWGRASTDDEGCYSFSTVLPGATQPDSAPFILVTVFARGLLNRLFTRAYLPGEQLAGDALLNSLPAERRHTMIAARDEHGLRFDIQLQGADETVFLRYPGHRP
jgi:protocatechuate 3,4-dioxygenase alpha subunit